MAIANNQSVVIIGGAGDIGRAVAELFAAEGAKLTLVDPGRSEDGTVPEPERVREAVAALRAGGAQVVACEEAVTDAPSAERAIHAGVEQFGRIDTLVHCAGIALDAPLSKVTEEHVARQFDTQVKGALFATQAAAKQLRAQKGPGRIVLTTGLAGLQGNFGQVAYSAASAAVYGIMRTASIELQRHEIWVNAVAPIAKTRQTASLPMFQHVDTLSVRHVAPAYLFLGSPLSGDLTGNALSVAGAKLTALGIDESAGRFKEDSDGVWTAGEIAEHWDGIAKT